MKLFGRDIKASQLPARAAGFIANKYRDARSPRVFNRWNGKTVSGKIKVGFLVQMPQVWDKQETVYRRMAADADFEPWLIVVPEYDFVNKTIGDYGPVLEFFTGCCENGKLIKAWENGKWADLKSMGFDYTFYQRPYDHYLPKQYQSDTLVKYTKICYIPYATPEGKTTGIYPSVFMRNVYFGFMEDENSARLNDLMHPHELHKSFLSLGYPVFEKAIDAPQECIFKSVLWTPRWTISGSHFLHYHKHLEEFDWSGKKLIVRPHPLMWSQFRKYNKITAQEAEDIQALWKEKNIEYDSNANIEDTFRNTDILLSDVSSVIPVFFLSGKPIVFCPSNMDFGPLFSSLLPGLYVAQTWEELKAHLDMLLSGEDPLRETRREIIEKSFSQNRNATEKIVEKIRADAYGKRLPDEG